MSDELQAILRLVAEGRLTPEEASPIVEALSAASPDRKESAPEQAARATSEAAAGRAGRQLRIRVSEHGRQVVNLRIPLTFAETALRMVPGIGAEQSQRIRDAVDAGALGPIVDVEDEDGSGVLITLE
jgi:hypothetical protein